MNKIKEIIYNNENINKNELMNILDNLTNIERNMVFNKLYNYNNTYNCTILQHLYSKYYNEPEIVIDMLKRYKDNININVKNLYGNVLLYYIICYRNMEIFKLIYELYEDVNVNILDINGNNMLSDVIYHDGKNMNKDKEIVKLLLEKNAKIQYRILIYIINIYNSNKIFCKKNINGYIDIILEYLHKNNDYDYMLEELYKYVIKEIEINEDNKEIYDKIFVIKSNTKSAAKI